jgi:hypothetical protein
MHPLDNVPSDLPARLMVNDLAKAKLKQSRSVQFSV